MASYLSRVERSAPIFSRITGLIRSGQLKWEDRPLWYDVYAAVPPYEEPVWDLKMPKSDQPVRSILYKEDAIRARFYNEFRAGGVTSLESPKPSVSEQFVKQYEDEQRDHKELTDDEIFRRTVKILQENGILRRRGAVPHS
uniref:Small ribosomal subunit protein mS23 n=1 Tax=Panagrellus redivivus TaxID=6233 RepID=A0A7E4UW86_PANRE